MAAARIPWWARAVPAAAWAILAVTPFGPVTGLFAVAAGVALVATVFAAVHHAEVVAHRTGEPFGTLVLAVAVTVIEVALIVSVMVSAPEEKAGLARGTVFAAVMIVCNGIVGLCLLHARALARRLDRRPDSAAEANGTIGSIAAAIAADTAVAPTEKRACTSTSQAVELVVPASPPLRQV